MKKILYTVALVATLGLTSCVKKTNTVGSSTGNDTLVKVDTTKVDTTKVDTTKVDTTKVSK